MSLSSVSLGSQPVRECVSSKVTRLPLAGVAQVILHGVRVVEIGVHEEREKEKDGEVQVEEEREIEENQRETLIMDGVEMTVKDSRTTRANVV